MAWIESHQELGAHPKTLKLARLLGIPKVQAVGHLQYLWWWATDYAQDGNLSHYEALDIAIGGEWEDDPDAFVDALVRACFLDRDGDHLTLHDWDDYAGRLIERREKNAQRMRNARAAQNPTQDEVCDERAAHVQGTLDARATLPNTTKPNQTEQDPTQPTPTGGAGGKLQPKILSGFAQFWELYPKRVGKGAAEKAWLKIKPSESLQGQICDAVRLQAGSPRFTKDNGQYIPNPATWLNERRWEDEVDFRTPAKQETTLDKNRRNLAEARAMRNGKEPQPDNVYETTGVVR
jgi:hypothetical protein